MDLAKLKLLLDNDPANAALSPEEAAAWCNARVMPVPVPAEDVVRYLTLVDKWESIKLVAEGDVVAEKKIAARKLVSALGDFESFDLANAQYLAVITARLDSLIAHNLLSASDKTNILALGNNKCTRAEAVGLGPVWGRDIVLARGNI